MVTDSISNWTQMMERGNLIVIVVVVAALALFGLRFFSGGAGDVDLASLSNGELGRPGDPNGGFADGDERALRGGGLGGRGGGDASGRGRGAFGASGTRLGPGRGFDSARGGSGGAADLARGGGSRAGGGVVGGGGGSGSLGSGGSAAIADSESGGRLAQRRDTLVESLGSRQPLRSDLINQPVPGENVALQVNSTEDIAEHAGYAEGEVRDADSDTGIEITENSRIEFPNAGNASKEGNISFTIKPEWAGGDATNNALVQIRQEHEWNNRLEIVKNGEFLRAILTDNTGKEADISYRITDWQPGQEYEVNFSWGEGRTELSVNNQIVGRNEYPGQIEFRSGTPMIFGADHPGSAYGSAQATIKHFTVGQQPNWTQ